MRVFVGTLGGNIMNPPHVLLPCPFVPVVLIRTPGDGQDDPVGGGGVVYYGLARGWVGFSFHWLLCQQCW